MGSRSLKTQGVSPESHPIPNRLVGRREVQVALGRDVACQAAGGVQRCEPNNCGKTTEVRFADHFKMETKYNMVRTVY